MNLIDWHVTPESGFSKFGYHIVPYGKQFQIYLPNGNLYQQSYKTIYSAIEAVNQMFVENLVIQFENGEFYPFNKVPFKMFEKHSNETFKIVNNNLHVGSFKLFDTDPGYSTSKVQVFVPETMNYVLSWLDSWFDD